jgi:hypothetical protein
MARKKDDAQKDPQATLALKNARDAEAAAIAPEQEQARREQNIAEVHEVLGAIRAMEFTRSLMDITTLMKLRDLKESKAYKEAGLTWAQACKRMGVSVRSVDDKLVQIEVFGQDFLGKFADFMGGDFNKIKMLGRAQIGNLAEIKGTAIVFEGEEIEIAPGNEDAVQGVLDRIQAKVTEAEAEARAQERITKDRDAHIKKLQKSLDRYEAEAAERDLTPDEDAALRMLDNLHAGLTGWTLRVDSGHIDLGTEPSPVVRARYLSILAEFRGIARSLFDRAEEAYGYDLADTAWTPPTGAGSAV